MAATVVLGDELPGVFAFDVFLLVGVALTSSSSAPVGGGSSSTCLVFRELVVATFRVAGFARSAARSVRSEEGDDLCRCSTPPYVAAARVVLRRLFVLTTAMNLYHAGEEAYGAIADRQINSVVGANKEQRIDKRRLFVARGCSLLLGFLSPFGVALPLWSMPQVSIGGGLTSCPQSAEYSLVL